MKWKNRSERDSAVRSRALGDDLAMFRGTRGEQTLLAVVCDELRILAEAQQQANLIAAHVALSELLPAHKTVAAAALADIIGELS